jgi:hypothetical protein
VKRPTAQEVEEYALKIGFKLKGEHFVDFYESKDWFVGKSPMKNWQAAVRTWKHNAPPAALIGQKYDPDRFDQRRKELEDLKEREWARRNGESEWRSDDLNHRNR